MFLPYYLLNLTTLISTKPFTMAFSNMPGVLKPITVNGRQFLKTQSYIIPSGKTGIVISCLSYLEYFKITMITDDSIMKDPQTLVDLIEKKI